MKRKSLEYGFNKLRNNTLFNTTILVRRIVNIAKLKIVLAFKDLQSNTPKKPRSLINNNIISNQAMVVKCMEGDIKKKSEEMNGLQKQQGLHLLLHFMCKNIAKSLYILFPFTFNFPRLQELQCEIEAISAANKESKEQLEMIRKKELQIDVDQIEEKKVALPSSRTTGITSAGSALFPSIREQPNVIEETTESLEVASNNIEKEGQRMMANLIDEGMSYLMSAEVRVSNDIIIECGLITTIRQCDAERCRVRFYI